MNSLLPVYTGLCMLSGCDCSGMLLCISVVMFWTLIVSDMVQKRLSGCISGFLLLTLFHNERSINVFIALLWQYCLLLLSLGQLVHDLGPH